MTSHITTSCLPQSETETAVHLFDNWFDPIEVGLRGRIRGFLQAMLEAELDEVLARSIEAVVDRRVRAVFRRTIAPARMPIGYRLVSVRRLNATQGDNVIWRQATTAPLRCQVWPPR
jgi:hypothetical protein